VEGVVQVRPGPNRDFLAATTGTQPWPTSARDRPPEALRKGFFERPPLATGDVCCQSSLPRGRGLDVDAAGE